MTDPRLTRAVGALAATLPPCLAIDSTLLHRRADLLALPRPGRTSANGSARLIRATDDWVALNLPRADDHALLPALVGEAGAGWAFAERTIARLPAAHLVERARLLGLALTRSGEAAPWHPPQGKAAISSRKPLVIDMSVLWAGPLCGALLAAAGCDVVKAELPHRRDTTATRSPEFDRELNGAKRSFIVHPGQLAPLLADADVLITNARFSSLAALGIDSESTRHLVWIAISAHGPNDTRIGFGDDAAVAGGLNAHDNHGHPIFLADAVADPLTGIAGGSEALHALAQHRTGRIDIALSAVAAWAARQ